MRYTDTVPDLQVTLTCVWTEIKNQMWRRWFVQSVCDEKKRLSTFMLLLSSGSRCVAPANTNPLSAFLKETVSHSFSDPSHSFTFSLFLPELTAVLELLHRLNTRPKRWFSTRGCANRDITKGCLL